MCSCVDVFMFPCICIYLIYYDFPFIHILLPVCSMMFFPRCHISMCPFVRIFQHFRVFIFSCSHVFVYSILPGANRTFSHVIFTWYKHIFAALDPLLSLHRPIPFPARPSSTPIPRPPRSTENAAPRNPTTNCPAMILSRNINIAIRTVLIFRDIVVCAN